MARFFAPSRSYFSGLINNTRRNLGFLTEQEADAAYLNEAQDLIDLEYRMRQLDHRPRRQSSVLGHWDY